MKLLYAEDEISMSEAVTDILEYHNYSVDAVYDGEEALEYARLEHYDGYAMLYLSLHVCKCYILIFINIIKKVE